MCQTPVADIGALLVELSFNGGFDFVASQTSFTFTENPEVIFKGPRIGNVMGGTDVSFAVTGTAEQLADFWCTFGSAASTLAVRTPGTTIVVCRSPPSESAGTTALRLHTNGRDMFEHVDRFTYTEVSTLTAVSPSFATTDGGSTVVIIGSNFFAKTNATARFGSMAAPGACAVLTHSAIKCVTPGHAPGNVNISVSFNGQDFVSASSIFAFRPPSSVVSLSVSRGPKQGGSKVMILGSNFVNASTLLAKFGQEMSPATFVNSTAIEATVPPQQQTGTVSVVVSTNGIDFTETNEDATFTYMSEISVSVVRPSHGPKAVSSAVTIVGTGFSKEHTLSCGLHVNNVRKATTPAVIINASALTCDVLPAASLGKSC